MAACGTADAMRHVCISRRLPGAEPDLIRALAEAETRAVWDLYAAGIVREIGFDAGAGRGILLLECADRAAAEAALATLPLVAQGQIAFDVHAFGPWSQLALLFAPPP